MKEKNPPPDLPDTNRYLWYNNPTDRKIPPEHRSAHILLAHPDPNISRLAANLISDKYQLSKYHTKFRELEQEEDKLDYLVPREIYSMKDAYILYKIKDIQAKIKEAQNKGDMEQIFDLMKQNAHLNEIKNVLCKELGERIVLKM